MYHPRCPRPDAAREMDWYRRRPAGVSTATADVPAPVQCVARSARDRCLRPITARHVVPDSTHGRSAGEWEKRERQESPDPSGYQSGRRCDVAAGLTPCDNDLCHGEGHSPAHGAASPVRCRPSVGSASRCRRLAAARLRYWTAGALRRTNRRRWLLARRRPAGLRRRG